MAKKMASPNVIAHEPASDIDWRARGDCETLERAEEVKRDKKRHGAAKKHAMEKAKSLHAIAGK